MVECRENYLGKTYGNLTIIKQVDDYIEPKSKNHKPVFLCKCNCGNETTVLLASLKRGCTTSCGCGKNASIKPLKYNENLQLNIVDNKHKPYGKCKTYNTNEWFYFSMLDYDVIKNYCWCVAKPQSKYHRLIASVNGKNIVMHKLFNMKSPDHINKNPLDNRRENLDEAANSTLQQQNRGMFTNNKSGCKGVSWHIHNHKWYSQIKVNYKVIYLGSYANIDDAIIARLKAEQKYFDKRAWQETLMKKFKLI